MLASDEVQPLLDICLMFELVAFRATPLHRRGFEKLVQIELVEISFLCDLTDVGGQLVGKRDHVGNSS